MPAADPVGQGWRDKQNAPLGRVFHTTGYIYLKLALLVSFSLLG
jgi:hypothetical protein